MSTVFARLLKKWEEDNKTKLLELLEDGNFPAEGVDRESFGVLIRLARMAGVRLDEFGEQFNLSPEEALRLEDGFLPPIRPLPLQEERHAEIVDWLRDVRLREPQLA